MAPFFVVFFRVMALKYAKDQGLCTTLCYVAFTDIVSMIDDDIRIQRTPRSMPAACSLTRTWSHPLRAKLPRHGQRTSDWGRTANPETPVFTSAEVSDLFAGFEIIANVQGNCNGHLSSLVW